MLYTYTPSSIVLGRSPPDARASGPTSRASSRSEAKYDVVATSWVTSPHRPPRSTRLGLATLPSSPRLGLRVVVHSTHCRGYGPRINSRAYASGGRDRGPRLHRVAAAVHRIFKTQSRGWSVRSGDAGLPSVRWRSPPSRDSLRLANRRVDAASRGGRLPPAATSRAVGDNAATARSGWHRAESRTSTWICHARWPRCTAVTPLGGL